MMIAEEKMALKSDRELFQIGNETDRLQEKIQDLKDKLNNKEIQLTQKIERENNLLENISKIEKKLKKKDTEINELKNE